VIRRFGVPSHWTPSSLFCSSIVEGSTLQSCGVVEHEHAEIIDAVHHGIRDGDEALLLPRRNPKLIGFPVAEKSGSFPSTAAKFCGFKHASLSLAMSCSCYTLLEYA